MLRKVGLVCLVPAVVELQAMGVDGGVAWGSRGANGDEMGGVGT